MSLFISLIWLLVGGVLLYYGADWLIDGGVSIARRAGVSTLVIGLTLVAFATSAPELVVSLQAGYGGLPDVSIGNVLGSNICNIALILGVSAVLYPINIKRQLLRFDMPVLLISTLAFALCGLWLKSINRICGLVFFAGILFYTCRNIRMARKDPESVEQPEESDLAKPLLPIWKSISLTILGIIGLTAGGKAFVYGAVELGHLLHISEAVIALTVVALGTSLPELATSALAAIRHESDLAIGNVVGSNIFNILCIMGITPMVFPLKPAGIVAGDWLVMLGISVILLPIVLTGKKISRLEGWFLLVIYAGYVTMLAMR